MKKAIARIVGILLLIGCCGEVLGKSPWFTVRTIGTNSVPLSAYTTQPTTLGEAEQTSYKEAFRRATQGKAVLPRRSVILPARGATINNGVIDLAISLYSNPQGNGKGNTRQTPLSEQDKYEEIIEYFADAVYEMTDGAHSIGKVRIFPNHQYQDKADVLWVERAHPHVGQGIGESVSSVVMSDVFANGHGAGMDLFHLVEREDAGYTLAHEWGHYFYGVYDEYQSDQVQFTLQGIIIPQLAPYQWPQPSIMSYQHRAAEVSLGDERFKWLNFSVASSLDPDQEFRAKTNTRQHACYEVSCWETVSSSTLQPIIDDLHAYNLIRASLGRRVVYPELSPARPAGKPRVDLPAARTLARQKLDIVWMGSNVVFQIVIDRSGSMAGTPLANAKNAAQLLVDQAAIGTSSIGVIMFDDVVTTVIPILDIQTQSDKDVVKTAIGGIQDRNTTAIYNAAQFALNGLAVASYQNRARVVFLLTDGYDNASSTSAASVIANYQAVSVPLFVIGYGTGIDESALRPLASQTGGKYYNSPQTPTEINAIFSDALVKATSKQGLSSSSLTLAAANASTSPFLIDSSIGTFDVVASFSGSTSDAALHLVSPTGGIVNATSVSTSGGKTFYVFNLTSPQSGQWQIVGQSSNISIGVNYEVTGLSAEVTYTASLHSNDGSDIVISPAPLILRTSLRSTVAVTGARLTAQVVTPSGRTNMVVFRDDGVYPDDVAGDGNYAASYLYTEAGAHNFIVQFDNAPGQAVETYVGVNFTPFVTNAGQAYPQNRPFTNNFTRFARQQITIQGVIQVDPAQNISLVSAPTTLDLSGNLVLNRQTGLYQQLIHITNNNATAVGGFRVFMTGFPAGVVPMNASGFDAASGRYFVLYEPGLAPGGTVDFGLEYYFPTRGAIPGAGIGLAAELTALTNSVPSGSILSLRRAPVFIGTNSVLIEFAATPGRQYQVQYSTNLTTWKTANAPITAAGSSVLWIDSGPPKTESPPSAAQSRYYRVLALP